MRRFLTYHQVESSSLADVPAQVEEQRVRLERRLAPVSAVWLVASGKGGVGKSAITANLAAGLAARGLAVGALDADLNGPSLARMLGARPEPLRSDDGGVQPARGVAGTRVVGSDLLLAEPDSPVAWKGPAPAEHVWQSLLETGAVRELLSDVAWGPLDILLLDLPPGTDKLRRVLELVPRPAGILLVTTPAEAARSVVARSLRLLRDLEVPRVALVANMTGHVCGRCGHAEPLFDADGARRLARDAGAETWAEVPFHPALARSTDAGRPLVLDSPANPAAAALLGLVERVAATLEPDAARAAGGPA